MATTMHQQHRSLSPTRSSMSILSSATTASATTTTASSAMAAVTTRPRQSSNLQTTPPIVVRAIYDYYSEDSTNLSFQAGTLIRVLTRLDTGWWDGFIGGERGWFPSNFVTAVDSSALLEDEEDDDEYLGTNDSSSLPSADEDEGERALAGGDTDDELMLASAVEEFSWIPQADKDGRTFYLNTATGDTSWELPGQKMFADEWEERRIDDDEDIAPRSSMESDASENILMLGPSIKPRLSVQNYNRLSIQSASSRSSHTKTNSVGSAKQLGLTPSFPAPPPAPTYETLFPPLRAAVDKLCAAASTSARTLFQPYADEVVGAVSTISASIPRDHKDPQIERFLHYSRYRPMVAALCSLITSTKLAAGDWSPDAQIRKMERDANEVLLRAEAFLDYAHQVDVHPRRVKPFFIQPEEGDGKVGGGWTKNLTGLSDMQHDHLETLSAELDKERENVEKCVKAMGLPGQGSSRGRKNSLVIVDDHLIIPFLLITVQETLTAVGTFMTLVEKADLSSLTEFGDGGHRSPTIADYATAKQGLYNAIGDLIIASQEITSTEEKEPIKIDMTVPPKSRKRKTSEGAKNVIKAGESLKDKVHSVCLNMSFMVEEEKMRRRRGSANDASPQSLMSAGTPGSFASGDFSQRSRSQARDPASKVKKIFGDDAPSPPPIQKAPIVATTTDTAWFLKHNLEDDLAYDVKGQVKGGTLDALIERLTRHDMMDSTFNSTFLLTFKSFTTAEDLFAKLKGRFDIQPPPGLSDTELDLWKEKVQLPIRFRVLNTFKSWMNNFYTGSPNDPILPAIKEWALTDLRQALPSANSQTLINCVEAQQTQAQAAQKVVTVTRQNAPPPVLPKKLPKDGKGLKLLDVHPVEIARQITIQQMGLYMRIKVIDCLDKAWSGDNASPDNNIKRMIYHANKLTGWAAESILMAGDIKRRVTMLKHWVQIADRCLAINNFSGLMSIISALNSTPIHRLKRTWEMVPSKTMQTFDELNKVMHSTMNFSVYREKIHTVSLPCLPFLGVYLSDLTFIEDGNPNMLRNNEKLINFSKRMKTAEVMRDLQQYQTVSYPFTRIIELQAWLDNELTNSSEIQELYDLSTQVEPREREDEKMYLRTTRNHF